MNYDWSEQANYAINQFTQPQRSALFTTIRNWANNAGAWNINVQQVLNTRVGAIGVRVTATRTAANRVRIDDIEP